MTASPFIQDAATVLDVGTSPSDASNTLHNDSQLHQLFPTMGFETVTATANGTGQRDPSELSLDSPWGSQVAEESRVAFDSFLKNYGPYAGE